MHSSHHPTRRVLLSVLTAAMIISAVTAGAATADNGKHRGRANTHQTPKVPLVIDGVRYAPKEIHRFDGRPLYMRLAGKKLIAYTRFSDYRTDLRKLGLRLPMDLSLHGVSAHSSRAGQWLKVCTGRDLSGDCSTIDSGKGVANFAAVNGCDWFGYCWNFINTISSVQTSGQYAMLFDQPDFNRGGQQGFSGSVYTVSPNTVLSLSVVGFDNITESGFMFW
jgi:hypothetical protein